MNPLHAKLTLQTLAEHHGVTVKRDALFAQVNFSADPVVTETEFDLLCAELERKKLITRVANPVTGGLRIGITANGVAALSEM